MELAIALLSIGIIGLVAGRESIVTVLMMIEILLLGVVLLFLDASTFFDDLLGEVFAITIISIAGAEVAIGLSILVLLYKLRGSIDIKKA